jgi:hypothetical protein
MSTLAGRGPWRASASRASTALPDLGATLVSQVANFEAASAITRPVSSRNMDHELVASVRLAEGEALSFDETNSDVIAITRLPERDPILATFLVSFAASAVVELLVALRRLAGARALTLAMRHQGRRLTIDTDDDGLDMDLLSSVMKDFYRDV